MPENLIYRIGDVGIQLTVDPGWEYALDQRFADFLSDQPSQTNYLVQINPLPVEPSGRPIFSVEKGWRLYQDHDRWIIWIRSQGLDPYLAGNFSHDFHSGEIFISESTREPGKFIFPISHPLGELLVTNLLGSGYGVMFHSCALIDQGDGILFAGVSTAGKSTTARLWAGMREVRVINDDRTIVRNIHGEYRVYGTPWHGISGSALAEDAPLKKIFILKHAPTNQAVRLSPAQAAAMLLVRAFAPLWSAPAMQFTLQFLDELCQAVPCYELGFVPDQSAVEYVRCLSAD